MNSTEQEQEQELTGLERRVGHLQLGQASSDDGENMDTNVSAIISAGVSVNVNVEDVAVAVAEDSDGDGDYAEDKMTTDTEPAPSNQAKSGQGSEFRAKRRFEELEADLRGLHTGGMSSVSSSKGFGNVAQNDHDGLVRLQAQIQMDHRSYTSNESKDDQGVKLTHKLYDDHHDDHDKPGEPGDLVLFDPTSHPRRSEFTFALTESIDEVLPNPFAGLYTGLDLDLGDGLGMGEALHPGLLFSTTFRGLSPGRRRLRRSVVPREVVAWRAVHWKGGGGTGSGNDTGKDDGSSIQGQCSEMGTSADGDEDALAGEMGESCMGGGGKRQRRE